MAFYYGAADVNSIFILQKSAVRVIYVEYNFIEVIIPIFLKNKKSVSFELSL